MSFVADTEIQDCEVGYWLFKAKVEGITADLGASASASVITDFGASTRWSAFDDAGAGASCPCGYALADGAAAVREDHAYLYVDVCVAAVPLVPPVEV